MKYIPIALLILFAACRKTTNNITNLPAPVAQSNDIDSVNVDIYLLDYDSMDYGNVNAQGVHVYDYHNSNHFDSAYILVRCDGTVLDSMELSVINTRSLLNMNPSDTIPDFSFATALGGFMHNELQDVRINRSRRTYLEVWNRSSIGTGMKLVTFMVGPYGFYGDVDDSAYSRSYLSADHSFKVMVTL